MTDEELKAIEALAERLDPGPWEVTSNLDTRERKGSAHLRDVTAPDVESVVQLGMQPDLAEFFAAARTAVPALVAEVRRLRGVIAGAGIRADQGDKDFCMWCGREARGDRQHTRDCLAFTPDGAVR